FACRGVLVCSRHPRSNPMAKITELKMQQGWLPQLEPDFLPATVRVRWSADAMLVEAELSDVDMFNPAKNFNDVAYNLGDVFEMFVRPEWQSAYYEVHVTPSNQVLQLRLADANEVKKTRTGNTIDEKLADLKVWEPRI